ncbi:hypothetical protein [Kineosporia sp. NBRC 101731]|uniref:hypothetical protein n=1 Tax=Kineosporia sp. NBRC 101731 TaxID=3032199 RepID=UPI0024A00FE4|nr:hypothetical protein [Kineosporia sp. NBRC 101731]GLY31341.1 hypothetical protein Kisp02_47060 [Kineosporia sp. NBRC 101731]
MNTTRRQLLRTVPVVRIPLQHNNSQATTDTGAGPASTIGQPGTTPSEPARPPRKVLPDQGAGRRPPFPPYLTRLLRGTALLDLATGVLMVGVQTGRVPGTSRVCEVATLGGHPQVVGLVAVLVAVALGVAALFTAGLTRAGSAATVGLVATAVLGLAAAAGVILVAALVLSIAGLTSGIVLSIMMGAVRGELTR